MMVSARVGLAVAGIAIVAGCGSSSSSTASAGNNSSAGGGGAGNGSSPNIALTLSGALQGSVVYDDDASSLGLGHQGCSKADIGGNFPFGIIFRGHVAGGSPASILFNIGQAAPSSSAGLSSSVSVSLPFNGQPLTYVDIEQGNSKWQAAAAGTLSMTLSGNTETGQIDADVSAGGSNQGLHVKGTWNCQLTAGS
jgi:hypothetical protein